MWKAVSIIGIWAAIAFVGWKASEPVSVVLVALLGMIATGALAMSDK